MNKTIGKDKNIFRVGSYSFSPGPNLEMYLGYQTVGGFTALFLHRYYAYVSHYPKQRPPEGWAWFSYVRDEDSKEEPQQPGEEVTFALANLERLGCISLPTTWGGGQIFSIIYPAVLGRKLVEACTFIPKQ